MGINRSTHLSLNEEYRMMMEARSKKVVCPQCGKKCDCPKVDGAKCECKECGKKFKPKAEKLDEGVTSTNAIHGEIEAYMEEFVAGIQKAVDAETAEAKLTELEQIDLTGGDKKIIAAIRKYIQALAKADADFQKFREGLSYEFVVTKKAGAKEGEAVAEDELEAADEQFEDEALAADEVATPVEK